jgi:mono/diheme cytochrome c family protein
MRAKANVFVLILGLVALLCGCRHPANISQQADYGIARPKMELMLDANADRQVHTIVMPHDEPVFPPGSGRDEFVTACVVCHSPRYITMQPRFSRTTWLSEVKKMKDVYGAHISDEQVVQITDYLFSINGTAGTGQGPKGTYGE